LLLAVVVEVRVNALRPLRGKRLIGLVISWVLAFPAGNVRPRGARKSFKRLAISYFQP
jgi:hypothetical protein